jgi:hypothetical protein
MTAAGENSKGSTDFFRDSNGKRDNTNVPGERTSKKEKRREENKDKIQTELQLRTIRTTTKLN